MPPPTSCEVRFVRELTYRPVKATLPGPYLLTRSMWVGAYSRQGYDDKLALGQDVVRILLGLQTSDATDFHRPIHVGFGLTQVPPIVVAALSARRRDLFLVKNLEVHLHPAGQALMGGFLASVAAAGIQVLLETHSDHVLNGVRRAVKAGVVEPTDVLLHFFRDRELEGEQVVSPAIDPDGNLDAWPEGFFDQFDKDMNHFAGWGD